MPAPNTRLLLINHPAEISFRTTHLPLLLTTSSRFRSRFSLARCHFPALAPHYFLYRDKCQVPSARLDNVIFSSLDVPHPSTALQTVIVCMQRAVRWEKAKVGDRLSGSLLHQTMYCT